MVDDLVDVVLRAHVDASGRLVQDQDLRVGGHPLGQHDLLLVAAGQVAGRHLDGRRLGAELLAVLLGRPLLTGLVHHAQPVRQFLQTGQGRVLANRLHEVQAVHLAVFGRVGHTVVDGGTHGRELDFLAFHEDPAGRVGAVLAAEHAHRGLGAARADKAGQTDDLAGTHVDAHVLGDQTRLVERVAHPPVLDAEHLLADPGGVHRVAVGQRTAHHVADQRVLVQRVGRVDVDMADGAAIADDLHRVRGIGDLVELVRNDDRGDALLAAKPVDQVEQVPRILVVQRGGRLVQDQQLHVLGQSLRDLDQLLLADTDVRDQGVRVLVQTDLPHHVVRDAALLVGIDRDALPLLIAQEDVLLDRHVRHQRKLLVDDHDALLLGIANRPELARLAVVHDVALVRAARVHTRQHVHQSRLARTVLTADREHLAPLDHDIHIVQRGDRAETLHDMTHLQNHVTVHSHSYLLR